MEILGYGEDGLTLLFLTLRRSEFFESLGETGIGPDSDVLIFYRPSLGRSGGVGSPQLGEFDAIVATRQAVYFIESKWTDSEGPINKAIILKKNQITRHRVFRAIREAWQTDRPDTWDQFLNKHSDGFLGRPIVGIDRLLGRNMRYLLKRLENHPDKILDILVYFHRADPANVRFVGVTSSSGDVLPEFRIVPVRYSSLEDSGFFALSS
jgi:hypothetical protein